MEEEKREKEKNDITKRRDRSAVAATCRSAPHICIAAGYRLGMGNKDAYGQRSNENRTLGRRGIRNQEVSDKKEKPPMRQFGDRASTGYKDSALTHSFLYAYFSIKKRMLQRKS